MLFSWNEDPTYFTQLQQYTVILVLGDNPQDSRGVLRGCTMSAGEHPTQNHKKLNIHAMSQSNKIIGLD